jgi:tetratricopeptide (TPR) repeat protein
MNDQVGNKLSRAHNLGHLGNIYVLRGELAKAEEHYQKALAIDEEIGDRLGQTSQLVSLGNVYYQRGELDKARAFLSQAKALYEAIGAGGPGPEIVREALERLGATSPPKGKAKRTRKKP